MKIFYHEQFSNHYAYNPAAEPGRLDPALAKLKAEYPVFEPHPATKEEVLLAHSEHHFERVAADQHAHNHCEGRLFAVLEGGYNARALAINIAAFLEGLSAELIIQFARYISAASLKANLIEKYNDLLAKGKSEEEAYNIVVAGIGDINKLINQLEGSEVNIRQNYS